MKKKILYSSILILCSCSSYMSNNYLIGLDVGEIKDEIVNDITYGDSHFVDYHFPETGRITEPAFDFKLRYDTIRKYNVILFADIIFKRDDKGYWDSSQKDSICLKKVIITCKNGKPIFIDINKPVNLHKMHIPKKFLLSIRDDFFKRMKYTKFELVRTKEKSYRYGHAYQLY